MGWITDIRQKSDTKFETWPDNEFDILLDTEFDIWPGTDFDIGPVTRDLAENLAGCRIYGRKFGRIQEIRAELSDWQDSRYSALGIL